MYCLQLNCIQFNYKTVACVHGTRLEFLEESFKIDINDIIMGNVRWMHMSLDEEFIEHWKSVGIQEGKAEGRKNLIAYPR